MVIAHIKDRISNYAAARILLAKGKKQEALDLMLLNDQITFSLDPYRKFYLGEVLRANDRVEEAKKAYQCVIDQYGENGYYGRLAAEAIKSL